MQQHLALLVDLRRHVQRDAGEEGVSSTLGVLSDTPDELVVMVVEALVTKYSSVPTLITAFWLLVAVTRGLERYSRPLGLEQVDRHVEVAVGNLEAGPAAQGAEDLVGVVGSWDGAAEPPPVMPLLPSQLAERPLQSTPARNPR